MSEIEQIFKCTRCGYCCHGETTVSLDESDQLRMCEALGMSRDQVTTKFWRITGNVVQMKVENGHCIFYNEGCMVHEGRPWRCGEWPLHPSLLTDINNYHTIAESCPGINTSISYDEFRAILKEVLSNSKRVKC